MYNYTRHVFVTIPKRVNTFLIIILLELILVLIQVAYKRGLVGTKKWRPELIIANMAV